MNRPSPICAEGWISIPVIARVSIDMSRGSTGTPAPAQRMRDTVGQQRVDAGPGGEDLRGADPAGGRIAVPCRQDVAPHLFADSRQRVKPTHADSVAAISSRAEGLARRAASAVCSLERQRRRSEERLRHVALARVGDHHDDSLSARLGRAATCSAAQSAAPPEMPASTPVRRAQLQAVWIASSSDTSITSSSSRG